MRLTLGIMIESVDESGCDEFFRYLNDHRSDRGTKEAGYFLPLSQSEFAKINLGRLSQCLQ
jgi:hypothetical protein